MFNRGRGPALWTILALASMFAVAVTVTDRSKRHDQLPDLASSDGLHPPIGKRAGMYPNDWFHRQRAYPNPDYSASAVERVLSAARAQRNPATWGPAGDPFGAREADETPWVPSGPLNIGGRITAVAVHPDVSDRIFIGVTRVAVDPDDPLIAYVTHSGYHEDEAIPHVHRTTDAGANWTPITEGLPDAAKGR